MANELQVSVGMRFIKGSTNVQLNFLNQLFTVSGTDYVEGTQSIGTSEEALNLGDCAAGGYLIIKNTDPTNFVTLRAGTGVVDTIKLKPGRVACFPLDPTDASAPYLIADTAACVVQYLVVEP